MNVNWTVVVDREGFVSPAQSWSWVEESDFHVEVSVFDEEGTGMHTQALENQPCSWWCFRADANVTSISPLLHSTWYATDRTDNHHRSGIRLMR